MMEVKIGGEWKEALSDEFASSYFQELSAFVCTEYQSTTVYPPPKDIFRALDLCPLSDVRVVILGQDPYHGAGQANGLCFAVSPGVKMPPSLRNIFKELESDLGHSADSRSSDLDAVRGAREKGDEAYKTYGEEPVSKGNEEMRQMRRSHDADLSRWATQGVLLLNATLTVRAGSAGSHQGKGWEHFTDAVIKKLNDEKEGLVFRLWGNYAKAKGAHIDRTKHHVIESAHPSPLSAYSGFFGSKPFSKANAYLKSRGQRTITW